MLSGCSEMSFIVTPAKAGAQDARRFWIPAFAGMTKFFMVSLALLFLLIYLHRQTKRLGFRIPSGGRVEVLWRGVFGMDAKLGTMGHGWPTVTTLGTVPERGELSAAK